MNHLSAATFLMVFVFFPGCASTPTHRVPLTGDIMVDGPRMIADGSPRDRVLWQYRTAAAAMRRGQFEVAKPLLDDALLTLGGVYGKARGVSSAGSVSKTGCRCANSSHGSEEIVLTLTILLTF